MKKLLTMLLVLAVKGALAGDLIDCEKAQLEVAVSVIFFDQSAEKGCRKVAFVRERWGS